MAPQFIPADSNDEQDRLLIELFMPPFRKGYVRVGPNKVLLPLYYLDYAERIEDMEVRDSDVWVVSHPKAGVIRLLVVETHRYYQQYLDKLEYRPSSLPDSLQDMLEFNEVNGELGEILLKKFTNQFRSGYVKSRGYVLPEYYKKFGQRVEELDVQDDDLWVVSFPKTGTTWTQEMAWVIKEDFDFERAKVPLPERFPFLDHTPLFDYTDVLPKLPELQLPLFVSDSVTYIDEMKSPRYIKTHLPWELLPKQIRDGTKKPKIIYVARNAKDTCVSYYHHCKILEGYSGSFDNYCKLFLGGSLCFAPFWPHVLNFWKRRDEPNILFLKYEDLKKDLPAVIRKTAEFLGKDLNEEQVDLLAEHLSFARMKSNPSVNYEAAIEINRRFNLTTANGHFMRSGQVGNYKEVMSPELIAEFDRWTQENLAGSKLTF